MKKRQEEHVDSEKWAIPYADLMTLLLAFFVVMYSLSSINEAKFRVLAESINQAFNGSGKLIQPVSHSEPKTKVEEQDPYRAANATPIARIRVPIPPRHLPLPGHEGAASAPSAGENIQTANLTRIGDEVTKALKPWIDSHQVVIRKTKLWLEIEIRTDVLFPSGVANLAVPAQQVLEGVAGVLARFPNPIRIEGYTDDRPISTFKFPSNWELSAARAGAVARLFSDHAVDPNRLAIFGWGQYHPVADNSTPAGRNLNRRIAIVVLGDRAQSERYDSNDSQSVTATAPAEVSRSAPVTTGTDRQDAPTTSPASVTPDTAAVSPSRGAK